MTRTERGGNEKGRGEELITLSRSEIHTLALVRTRAVDRLSQLCSLDDMRFYALVIDVIDKIFDEPSILDELYPM